MDETIVDKTSRLFSQRNRQEENTLRSDITIVAGKLPNVERFPADTFILNIASPWFESLISNQMNGEVHIHDVHPTVMKKILRYVYSDNLDVDDAQEAMKIFFAAEKFQLLHLKSACNKYLNEFPVTSHNATHLFEMSYEDGFPNILSKSAEVLFKKTDEFLKDNGLSSASQMMVQRIVQQAFSVDETILISSILKWCSDRSGSLDLNQIRQTIWPHVRLLRLSNEEFADIIIPRKVLTPDEITAVYSYKNASPNNRLPMPPNLSVENRQEQYIPLNLHTKSTKPEMIPSLYRNDTFSVVFTIHRDCFIEGVALPIIINPGYQLTMEYQVSLIDLKSGIKYRVPSILSCDVNCNSDSIIRFHLSCSLYVKKDTPMKLKIKNLTGPECFNPVVIDDSAVPAGKPFKAYILNVVNRKGKFEWMGKPIAYIHDTDLKGFQISALLLLF